MALNFHKDQMVVNSNIKLTYFTLDGEYIREQKAPPGIIFNPKENGYLGTGIAPGAKGDGYFICFRLFDNDYKLQTTLYETEVSVGRISKFIVPMNALHYNPIYKDKLFIVNGKKGFCIDVFDLAGKKLYTIEKEVEKLKVPASYKKMAMDWFKKHPNFRNIFSHIKDRIAIKEYFPPIHDISLFDDKIFVITNKEEKGLTECIVTDLKGKELKRLRVSLQEAEPYTYYPLLYTIHDGKYFALLENEDEEWELHVKKI
ncbi:MAG: hypothetical protein GY757_21880 [bacterium]|nr:hypothetical protein [bacterium]